jgi:SAM-dependent methyltransferase
VLVSTEDVTAYIAEIESPDFKDFCRREAGVEKDWIDTAKSEIAAGLDILLGHELAGRRILEVGAGTGLLSILLRRRGYDVTALDPSRGGFEAYAGLGLAIRKWFRVNDLPFLSIDAAELNPSSHGKFDLIFSVNVLEHIPDLREAFHAMASVLSTSGRMIHLCPNYTIPYEPHFGLPLVPFVPSALALVRPALKYNGLWRSLNFVTSRDILRYARECGLAVEFAPRMMLRAFERLPVDSMFRERQKGIATTVFAILVRLHLLSLIGRLPYWFATPMLFECRRITDKCLDNRDRSSS